MDYHEELRFRRTRRFNSAFTVWYKEDMGVFGWVKHLLGAKIDNYTKFEDGILMCAIVNKLWEGSIAREDVLYGSALQRLELSIKAMYTFLGVPPMLDTCAVVEGRGQEELLVYLLKLKLASANLQRQQEYPHHEERWLMRNANLTRCVIPSSTRNESIENNGFDPDEKMQKKVSQKPSKQIRPPLNTTNALCARDDVNPRAVDKYNERIKVKESACTAAKGAYGTQNTAVLKPTLMTTSSSKENDKSAAEPLNRSHDVTAPAQGETACPHKVITASTQSETASSPTPLLRRQDTYVIESKRALSGTLHRIPPKILKCSSLTATLTPPASPLDKNRKGKDNVGSKFNDQTSEKELVTNLNDLFYDTSSTRKFPRSGFDRSVLYSPFSMPFISVRQKDHSLKQIDQRQNTTETNENHISSSNNSPSSTPKTLQSDRSTKNTATMMARLASRTPKGDISGFNSDELSN